MGCLLRGFVYLVFSLVVLGAVVLVLVIASEEPSPGTGCTVLGEQVTRKQDGVRLECIENMNTGKYFWRKIGERK